MEEYVGYLEATMTDDEIAAMYEHQDNNFADLMQNQYVIVNKQNGEYADAFKWSGSSLSRVLFKAINNRYIGRIKPRNIHQQLAVDMLYDPGTTVKVLTGKFGTGKDFLMSSAAMDLLDKGRFQKIVYIRNNIEVKNSKPIGYLPGDYNAKLLPFAMPLADHVGGVDGLELLINQGKIEVVHLGFLRGRDIKNAIILCSEAENMTKEHIQLLLGRVGDGSALWLNGDFKQTDADVFSKNSGLMTAIDKLKGHPRFACVKLVRTERSETAAMADLLD